MEGHLSRSGEIVNKKIQSQNSPKLICFKQKSVKNKMKLLADTNR